MAFEGRFTEWTAAIAFDPADLANSRLEANFMVGSAETGNAMYDGTLPETDWFNAEAHPEARFVSTAFEQDGDGYVVSGDLTIRGITQPVRFPFTLTDLSATPVTAEGAFEIDRVSFDIGKKSDADGQWVSKMIGIGIAIAAEK
mgnify:CR=1 FL=1